MKIKSEELKKAVWRTGYSMVDFCDKVGIRKNYLYQATAKGTMSFRYFVIIAEALGMTEEELEDLIVIKQEDGKDGTTV